MRITSLRQLQQLIETHRNLARPNLKNTKRARDLLCARDQSIILQEKNE